MRTIIFLIIISFLFLGHSQTSTLKYNRPFVIIEGCDDAENKEACFALKSSEILLNTLPDSINLKLIERRKKDTITLSIRYLFDEEGHILPNESFIHSSVDSTNKELKYLFSKFPKVKPLLDEFDNGVASYLSVFYGFTVDTLANKLVPISYFEPKEVPFVLLDRVPVFNGCDRELTNEDLGKCMNRMMNLYIQKNFRGDRLAQTIDLPVGINSIFLFFNINKDGKIKVTGVRAPHPFLSDEGMRLINGLPDAVEPGYLNDKPVTTPYFLPVRFVIEGDSPKREKTKN